MFLLYELYVKPLLLSKIKKKRRQKDVYIRISLALDPSCGPTIPLSSKISINLAARGNQTQSFL